MKIYTKTGDSGKTSLFGGKRVLKLELRVECYGTVDELNSIIGLVLANEVPQKLKPVIEKISNYLFNLATELATPPEYLQKLTINRINIEHIELLEGLIDEYTGQLPLLSNFILPGGTKAAAFLHQARTVCRRGERLVVSLSQVDELSEFIIKFLNRLSDFLFTAARYANFLEDVPDVKWEANTLVDRV